ncbi:MauE/DoxX family redox-associated membrane protein [Falsarthrobacter nasiphocae]|uniref:Methylamine utilisation protein MauE domain-containing protein n=1 Tax=Falsarthrobacter nasiphocae TaxID=189863 RepID=A0AAE3YG67_9MICC|nr:MauE/DoxX family redox-associated membrane protein [Falsarthrobacter nasiphocae]MDR6891575.1 hypothetical protein [Falsarthrobacter nasiphocae]
MILAFASALCQLFLAGVFVASGVGKLRNRSSVPEAVKALGLPPQLGTGPAGRAFPWLELVLAAALLLMWGPLGLIPVAAAGLLCLGFTVLVGRAVASGTTASCNCFGAKGAPMSRLTVLRNGALTLTATAALAGRIAGGPSLDTLLREGAVAGAAALVVVGCALWFLARDSAPAAEAAAPAQEPASAYPVLPELEAEDEEYRRRPSPAVQLTGIGPNAGETLLTTELVREGPAVVLYVSPYCGSCTAVLERGDEITAALPGVSVLFLFSAAHEDVPDEWEEPGLPLYRDTHDAFAGLLGITYTTPALVLLGTDGLLAAGPEFGVDSIMDTVREIAEVLEEARQQQDTDQPRQEADNQ